MSWRHEDLAERPAGEDRLRRWSRFRKGRACCPPSAGWRPTCPQYHRTSAALPRLDTSPIEQPNQLMRRMHRKEQLESFSTFPPDQSVPTYQKVGSSYLLD